MKIGKKKRKCKEKFRKPTFLLALLWRKKILSSATLYYSQNNNKAKRNGCRLKRKKQIPKVVIGNGNTRATSLNY